MFLKDRTAAITGSTSGIGLAYARALAKEGANLVINGILPPADAEKLRTDLEQEFGVKVVFSAADMTKPAEIAGPAGQGLLLVLVVDDVDTEFKRIEEAGARVITAPETEPWGERFCQFADPNGLVWQLVQWV